MKINETIRSRRKQLGLTQEEVASRLGVTATADALDAALDKAYEAVGEIRFENAHYRKDIGRTR